MGLTSRLARLFGRERRVAASPLIDEAAVRRALAANQRLAQGRLPAPAMAKLLKIQNQIVELLPQAGQFPTGSRDLYVVQRTATDYLPATLQAYLALPPRFAATQVVEQGKTAVQLLDEQLDLLAAQLDDIADAVHRQDSDRLLANGRFLEERFGDKSDLALPKS